MVKKVASDSLLDVAQIPFAQSTPSESTVISWRYDGGIGEAGRGRDHHVTKRR